MRIPWAAWSCQFINVQEAYFGSDNWRFTESFIGQSYFLPAYAAGNGHCGECDHHRAYQNGFLPRCKLLFNFPFHIATITSQQYGILYVKIIFSRDFLLQTTTFSRDFLLKVAT
ncbi:MAG: hypothetical protein II894_05745, partial [Bacteroidales bacterium]|nr:hypothetical protein [Bacteroidales bacterium]